MFYRLFIFILLGILFFFPPLSASDLEGDEGFQAVSYKKKKVVPSSQKRKRKKPRYSSPPKKEIAENKRGSKVFLPPKELLSRAKFYEGKYLKNLFLLSTKLRKKQPVSVDWVDYEKAIKNLSFPVEVALFIAVRKLVKTPNYHQSEDPFIEINRFLHQHRLTPRAKALYAMTLQLGLGVIKSKDRALKFAKQAYNGGEVWLSCFFKEELGPQPKVFQKKENILTLYNPRLYPAPPFPEEELKRLQPGASPKQKLDLMLTSFPFPGLEKMVEQALALSAEKKDTWGGCPSPSQGKALENMSSQPSIIIEEIKEEEPDQGDVLNIPDDILSLVEGFF